MRVVLDSNSLLVSIGRKSPYRPIFDALLTGQICLLLSNDILSEYIEVIDRKANSVVAENIAKLLVRSPDVEFVNIYFKWAAIYPDADDNKFVDCALNGRADFLVTDDKHFNLLKEVEFPRVDIIRTKTFLQKVLSLG